MMKFNIVFFTNFSFLIVNIYIYFIFKLESPVVDVQPRNQTVLEEESTVISCTAKGVPRPELSWTFENGELPPHTVISNLPGHHILLSKISKRMEGWYTCRAKNKAGEAFSNSTLHVLGLF